MAAIGRALNETLDLDHVLQLIVSSARQIIPKANLASTLLLDETRHAAYAVTERGRPERSPSEEHTSVRDDPLGEMIEAGQVVNIPDLQQSDSAAAGGYSG